MTAHPDSGDDLEKPGQDGEGADEASGGYTPSPTIDDPDQVSFFGTPEPPPAPPPAQSPEQAAPAPAKAGHVLKETPSGTGDAYRVLARKYRPSEFGTLIGQQALVTTLTNAIAARRIHHAYMLTGVRGVGKTTTARLIARALNYKGPDGTGEPTTAPTHDCPVARAIGEGRHVDVIEMDAASNTGVDDIREVIEGARYAPSEARYKIYIIDEVHMLSKSAFNALLKTLEEPPPWAVFIMATTEIRKVPVTVLSRCLRFDLRRVAPEVLAAHFASVADQEGVAAEEEALALIARAADGSVRDGLSLLDQAIALGDGKTVTAGAVREMLGLADRARIADLFEAVHGGEVQAVLDHLAGLHRDGADPAVILDDLLEVTHQATRFALIPGLEERDDSAAARIADLGQRLGMAELTRTWQMLMQGRQELMQAPNAAQALEMVLLRLVYAADLPDPADALRKLTGRDAGGAKGATGPAAAPAGGPAAQAVVEPPPVHQGAPVRLVAAEPAPPSPEAASPPQITVKTLDDVLELLRDRREMQLFGELRGFARLVRMEDRRLEFERRDDLAETSVARLAKLLTEWTGEAWAAKLVDEPGLPSVQERQRKAEADRRAAALADPAIRQVMAAFPEAELVEVWDREVPDGETDTDGEADTMAEPDTGAHENPDDFVAPAAKTAG